MAKECVIMMQAKDMHKHGTKYQAIQMMLVQVPEKTVAMTCVLSMWVMVHVLLFDFGKDCRIPHAKPAAPSSEEICN